ncbi:MAG: FprA family A-type flavoprotein [Sphaerochaetaceae bacterium]
MKPNMLADDVYRVYAKIGDRDLFEGIWPIPDGVMLNSYVVKGRDKIAFIDMVKDWDGALYEIESQLDELGLSFKEIDYLILNHMEPDHTGALNQVVAKNPDIKILTTKKGVELVKAFYKIEKNVNAVASGDRLDLGNKTILFEETPNIHWPETMMSYLIEDKILFSCDAFGSFGRYEHCFDDELSQEEWDLLIPETYRYYANIVSTFSQFVLRGIEKLKNLDIKIVGPSHGVVWRKDPSKIISLYKNLAEYMEGKAEEAVTLVYSSMYGNTAALVPVIKETLEQEGLKVYLHQVPQEHGSYVLSSAWRSTGLVVGMPTYEYRMFPPMYHVLDLFERSHLKNRKVMRFGSFGWSGGAQKQFEPFKETLNWECCTVVEYQGAPSEKEYERAVEVAKKLANKVKEVLEVS